MLARLRAQAQELQAKASAASMRGDQPTYERCHRAWVRIMKQALALSLA